MKPFFPFALSTVALTLISCGPVEPEVNDGGSLYSQASVGQWEPDLHDRRIVADRTTVAEINRTLLASAGTGALLAEYAFGEAEPAEDFRYIDITRGFAVDLPYNENWSTGTYVLPPFELFEEVSEIRFGPLLFHAQNGYQRAYILRYIPARTPEEAVRFYEERLEDRSAIIGQEQAGTGSVVTVTGLEGDCPAPAIEVPGEKYNYIFTASCESVSRWSNVLERLKEVAGAMQTQ